MKKHSKKYRKFMREFPKKYRKKQDSRKSIDNKFIEEKGFLAIFQANPQRIVEYEDKLGEIFTKLIKKREYSLFERFANLIFDYFGQYPEKFIGKESMLENVLYLSGTYEMMNLSLPQKYDSVIAKTDSICPLIT